ncbi:MAG: PilZ domain-containing protein [Acidobacteria bacterium]|jgi:c-di-GMP-binding flagellar brake protein YcgR|nr:MAG: PilZ domain-containing protein [Acidobacteriota bacterium]
MKSQGGFETFREATRYMFEAPSLYDVFYVILGFALAIGFLILFPYLWSRYKLTLETKREFFKMGKNLGLNTDEIEVLWKYASDKKEPVKVFQSKGIFERCVSEIVRENSSKIDMISTIRSKLRFNTLPWFLPLSTTREIDIYQTGFVTYKGNAYSAAVWDKNERELHIALLDKPIEGIGQGEQIKFSFLREGDGRYYFQSEVQEVYREGSKLVVVVPHLEKLSKIQLRESLRWKVHIPAKLYVYTDSRVTYLEEPREEELLDCTVEDISTSGLNVCTRASVFVMEGYKVFLCFELKGYPIRVFATVRNLREGYDKRCMGVKFDNLSKANEGFIRKFIIEEQQELLRAYKMGETKGHSSSSEPL